MEKRKKCSPEEAAIKSFFLGPQAENEEFLTKQVGKILSDWVGWRKSYFPQDGVAIPYEEQNSPEFQKKINLFEQKLNNLSDQFKAEIPKFSPRYVGHMVSELSLPALLGHILCLLHNPNNVAKEASVVGIDIEKKAIQSLCDMILYPSTSMGHFTSGGTIANYESIVRAKIRWLNTLESNWNTVSNFIEASLCPSKSESKSSFKYISDIKNSDMISKKFSINFSGPCLIVPKSKHYSWTKAALHFGLGKDNIVQVNLNSFGQIDIPDLKSKIDQCLKLNKPILAVVSICGTTELGTIDAIDRVQNLLDEKESEYGFKIWHHIDAAYGGFFTTLNDAPTEVLEDSTTMALQAVGRSTSVTIDPHKLGYVPYACGAFLCREQEDYFLTEEGAPYVDFQKLEDRGLFTIEGSRSATGAVATYLTSECIGFNREGYGQILLRSLETTKKIKQSLLRVNPTLLFVETMGTNILCFTFKDPTNSNLSASNLLALNTYHNIQTSTEKNKYFVSKTRLKDNFSQLVEKFCLHNNIIDDCAELMVLRITIMNPFFSSTHTETNFIEEFSTFINENMYLERSI